MAEERRRRPLGSWAAGAAEQSTAQEVGRAASWHSARHQVGHDIRVLWGPAMKAATTVPSPR